MRESRVGIHVSLPQGIVSSMDVCTCGGEREREREREQSWNTCKPSPGTHIVSSMDVCTCVFGS